MNTEKYPNSAKAARTIWLVLLFTVCPLYAHDSSENHGPSVAQRCYELGRVWLDSLSEEQRTKIAQETLDIYAPIAHRLGMSKIKNELEELAFRHLEPKAHKMLRAWVEERRSTTEATIAQLKEALEIKLHESKIPVVSIEGRLKRLFSIRKLLVSR